MRRAKLLLLYKLVSTLSIYFIFLLPLLLKNCSSKLYNAAFYFSIFHHTYTKKERQLGKKGKLLLTPFLYQKNLFTWEIKKSRDWQPKRLSLSGKSGQY